MTARAALGLLLLAVAAGLGCAQGSSTDNGGFGGRSQTDASPGFGGASAGTGGAYAGTGGAYGIGGATASGSGGSTGAAGASGSGGGTGQCAVNIVAVSGIDLYNSVLPAGPDATLRLRGSINEPPQLLPKINWRWTVTASGNPVTVTPDADDPSLVTFPLTVANTTYQVAVQVSDNPPCRGSVPVNTASDASTFYWVRVTATNAPPHDDHFVLLGRKANQKVSFNLDYLQPVTISPGAISPGTMSVTTVPSYVSISSPTHTWMREGQTYPDPGPRGFPTRVVDDLTSRYDVLVVPFPPAPYAPLLLSGLSAGMVLGQTFQLDASVSVLGALTVGGRPVEGATVELRAGALPSTLGTSDSKGSFTLLARQDHFSALILPPDSAGLPDARVDATATTGIDLPDPLSGQAVTLAFDWRADLGSTNFNAKLVTAAGAPAGGVDVSLDSADGAWSDVGTLSVTGGPSDGQVFAARGVVHRTATTDNGGVAAFTGLPRGHYVVTAVPPVSSADGVTVSAVDLSQAPPAGPLALAAKVVVTGQITNPVDGMRILIIDDLPLPEHVFPPAPLATDGSYTLTLDPSRRYRLIADPPGGTPASRVPLGEVTTVTAAMALGARALPPMLTVQGTAAPYGQSLTPPVQVAGAVVQMFCVGTGPDCLDFNDPSARQPPPLYETTVDATGAFRLYAPDPAGP
jgi:hypothetical protein